MKEYLDKEKLMAYLETRAEIAECVVNEDDISEETKTVDNAVRLDRKRLVDIIGGMDTENPYEKILHKIDYEINYFKEWLPYEISQYAKGRVDALENLKDFIEHIDEREDPCDE